MERRTINVGTEGQAWLKMTIDWDSIPAKCHPAVHAELNAFAHQCRAVQEFLPPKGLPDQFASLTSRVVWLGARLAIADPSALEVAFSVFRLGSEVAKLIDRDVLAEVAECCPQLEPACASLSAVLARVQEQQRADMPLTLSKGHPVTIFGTKKQVFDRAVRPPQRDRHGPTKSR